MDEKSAFGGYGDNDDLGAQRAGVVLAEFMKQYYADYRWWADRDPDAHNSPFPSELKTNAAFEAAMQQFEKARSSNRPWTLTELVEHLFKHVFDEAGLAEPEGVAQVPSAERQRACRGDAWDERRLEIRRVPAPPNRAALLDQLRRVADLLASARSAAHGD